MVERVLKQEIDTEDDFGVWWRRNGDVQCKRHGARVEEVNAITMKI